MQTPFKNAKHTFYNTIINNTQCLVHFYNTPFTYFIYYIYSAIMQNSFYKSFFYFFYPSRFILTKPEIYYIELANTTLQQSREQKSSASIRAALHTIYPKHNANSFRIFLSHILENVQEEWEYILLSVIDNIIDIKYLHCDVIRIAEKIYALNNKHTDKKHIDNSNTDDHLIEHTVSSHDFFKPYPHIHSLTYTFNHNLNFLYNFSLMQILKKVFPKHDPILSPNIFKLLVNLSTLFSGLFYEYDALILCNFIASKSDNKRVSFLFYHNFSIILLKKHKFCNFLICLQKMSLLDKKVRFNEAFLLRIGRICVYKEEESVILGDWKYSLEFLIGNNKRENEIKYEFDFSKYNLLEESMHEKFMQVIKEKRKVVNLSNEESLINKLINEVTKKGSVSTSNCATSDCASTNNAPPLSLNGDLLKFVAFLKLNNFTYEFIDKKLSVTGFEEKKRIVKLFEMKESMKRRQLKNKVAEKEDSSSNEGDAKECDVGECSAGGSIKDTKAVAKGVCVKVSTKKNDYFRVKYNLFRIVAMKIKEYFVNANDCDLLHKERENLRRKIIKMKNEIEETKKNEIEKCRNKIENCKLELCEKEKCKISNNEMKRTTDLNIEARRTIDSNIDGNNVSFRRNIKKSIKEEESYIPPKVGSNAASDVASGVVSSVVSDVKSEIKRGAKLRSKECFNAAECPDNEIKNENIYTYSFNTDNAYKADNECIDDKKIEFKRGTKLSQKSVAESESYKSIDKSSADRSAYGTVRGSERSAYAYETVRGSADRGELKSAHRSSERSAYETVRGSADRSAYDTGERSAYRSVDRAAYRSDSEMGRYSSMSERSEFRNTYKNDGEKYVPRKYTNDDSKKINDDPTKKQGHQNKKSGRKFI